MFWRAGRSKNQEKDIFWALGLILKKRRMKEIRESVDASQAIEEAAQRFHLDVEKLLQKVSLEIGLPSVFDPHPPRPQVVESSGFEAEELRSWNVLPHYSDFPCGYGLTISDPKKVCIEEFRTLGVPISLGLGSQIEKAWGEYQKFAVTAYGNEKLSQEQYNREKASQLEATIQSYRDEDMLPILSALAEECHMLGAQDARLFNGSRCCYEFESRGNSYSGSLHPDFLRGLQSFLSSSPIFAFRSPSENLSLLVVQRESDPSPSAEKTYRLSWQSNALLDASSRNILLIDDDEKFLFLLGTLLRNQNYQVWSASRAQDVLPKLLDRSLSPDVILCDVHMPGIDGGGFLAALVGAHLNIPTLILTSDEEIRTQTEMIRLGASAFLQKSGDPAVLLAWIENLLQRNSRTYDS